MPDLNIFPQGSREFPLALFAPLTFNFATRTGWRSRDGKANPVHSNIWRLRRAATGIARRRRLGPPKAAYRIWRAKPAGGQQRREGATAAFPRPEPLNAEHNHARVGNDREDKGGKGNSKMVTDAGYGRRCRCMPGWCEEVAHHVESSMRLQGIRAPRPTSVDRTPYG